MTRYSFSFSPVFLFVVVCCLFCFVFQFLQAQCTGGKTTSVLIHSVSFEFIRFQRKSEVGIKQNIETGTFLTGLYALSV